MNSLAQGFPTFYMLCPPKSKNINVASPQESVASPQRKNFVVGHIILVYSDANHNTYYPYCISKHN